MNIPASHFEILTPNACHAGCAQFEKQWPPENQLPFSHPISKSFQFLSLWHAPDNHEVWLEKEALQEQSQWLEHLKNKKGNLPRLCSDFHYPKNPLLFWGASPMATQWAQQKKLSLFQSPSLETLRMLHDKRWLETHRLRPLLEEIPSYLISTLEEVAPILAKHPRQSWMFKRSWSAAGMGNFVYHTNTPVPSLIKTWLEKDSHLLLQPLLSKTMDFSSLWHLSSQGAITFLGSTQMLIENSSRYGGCWIKEPEDIFSSYPELWQVHVQEAHRLIDQMHKEGYFGYLGFDGLLYETQQGPCQAIIEINVRQTLAMHLNSCVRTLGLKRPALAKLKTSSSKQTYEGLKSVYSLLPSSSAISIELYEIF